MSNVLSVKEKKQQVIALGRLGWSRCGASRERRIFCRETAGAYLRAAGIAVRPPGGWGRNAAKPAIECSPTLRPVKLPPQPNRSPSASACEPHREVIEAELAKGRNAMAIWQDLVDGHGFAGRYASVKRFVRKLCRSPGPEARVVIETAPGEEAQVDYGTGPMVRDPQSGKYRRTRLFVLTLGHSRKSVRLLVFRSSSRVWAELHEKAFRRLGGVTRVVVLDNLREGVITPDIYDATLNPLYRDVLKHYGAVALPCRVRDPDRKGKVESGVGHAQKTPLKGQRFESVEEAQAYLDHWEERWGRHADLRDDQEASRRHVRGREIGVAASAGRAFSLLPLRRADRASGRLRRSRGRLLWRTSGLDRRRVHVQWNEAHVRLIDPLSGAAARALAATAWKTPHSRARSSRANTVEYRTATAPRRSRRTAHRRVVPGHASKPGRGSGAPHPRRPEPDQEVRRRFHR